MAFGEAGFNVATIFVAPAKVGNLGRVGEVAEQALKVTDPVYVASKALSGAKSVFGPTVEGLSRLGRAADLDGAFRVTSEIDIPAVTREGVGVDHPNVGGHEVDAPPARDYTEPEARHDVGGSPDHSSAPVDDRQLVTVGGHSHGDASPAGHHGGGDTPASSGGHDGPGGGDGGAPSDRDGSGSPAGHSGEQSAPTTGHDGDPTSTAGRDTDTPATTNHDGGQSPTEHATSDHGSGDPATGRDGHSAPGGGPTHSGGDTGPSDHSDGNSAHETPDDGNQTHQPTPNAPDLPSGLAHRPWEGTSHGYGPDTHVVDDAHPPVDFGTKNSHDLGRYGEDLTERDLVDRGYQIVAEQAQIQLPNGKFFKPDFIVVDPQGDLVLVESKMGPGARFTPNQLTGYEHYAKGLDDLAGRSVRTDDALQDAFAREGVTTFKVDHVEVYRWNTEIVPSASLRSRAGVP